MKRDDLITLLPCRVTLKLSLIEVCPICFPSRKLTFEESLFSINSTKSIKLIMHNENPNRVHWLPTQDYSQFLILNVWDQSQFNELTERRKYGTNSSYLEPILLLQIDWKAALNPYTLLIPVKQARIPICRQTTLCSFKMPKSSTFYCFIIFSNFYSPYYEHLSI